MVDFGVMDAMRRALKKDPMMMEKGMTDCIHLFSPTVAVSLPSIVIDLEEIWMKNHPSGPLSPKARVRIKAHVITQSASGRDSLVVSQTMRKAWERKMLDLGEGCTGIVRLEGSVIDMPKHNQPRSVTHYFDVLIRG